MQSPSDAKLIDSLKKNLSKLDRELASLLLESNMPLHISFEKEQRRRMIAQQIKRLGGK